MKVENQIYLGDGVYAIYDGYSIWLRVGNHKNTDVQICLEPSVLKSLNEFYAYITNKEDEKADLTKKDD